MAQIPIFVGGQRIDPSSPVPVGGADSAAGNLAGNATESFGKAMFELGNELDKAGKRAKDEADKLSVEIAVNNARFALLEEKARQEAAGLEQGDRPDGFSGVARFKDRVDPKLKDIGDGLANEKMRGMYYAKIGDDFIKDSTLVLADEVKKRETNLPIMRQDNINGKAALVRKDPSAVFGVMGEVEANLRADQSIAGESLAKAIIDAKQQVGKEWLAGFIDRGNSGDTRQWDAARVALRDNLAQVFNSDQMEKELKNINEAENSWYTRQWQKYTQGQRVSEDIRKKDERDAITYYNAQLAQSGNDQFKFNAVQARLQGDPRLSGDAVKRLMDNRSYMETKDDVYEGGFMTTLLKQKNYGQMIDKVNTDYIAGKVSADRRDKLLKVAENFQDNNRMDPMLQNLVSTAKGEISKYAKPATFDPVSGMMKQENDTVNGEAQTMFMTRIAAISAQRKLTPGDVTAVQAKVIHDYYGGKTISAPVRGVQPSAITTTKDTQGAINALAQDYVKNGKSWTPQQKKDKIKQLDGLKQNLRYQQQRDQIRLNPNLGTGGAKVFDE